MKDYERSQRGRWSRQDGQLLEAYIELAADYYASRGLAQIDKTPEAFKVLRPFDQQRKRFICCFTKQAQPDFKGTITGGQTVLFDAKYTGKARIGRDCVTEEQADCFDRYERVGAICFLVISLGFEKFYRVPWEVFRGMKENYGHKYMGEEELAPFEVPYTGGRVLFLSGLVE